MRHFGAPRNEWNQIIEMEIEETKRIEIRERNSTERASIEKDERVRMRGYALNEIRIGMEEREQMRTHALEEMRIGSDERVQMARIASDERRRR